MATVSWTTDQIGKAFFLQEIQVTVVQKTHYKEMAPNNCLPSVDNKFQYELQFYVTYDMKILK